MSSHRGRIVEYNANVPDTGVRDGYFHHPFLAEPVPLWVLYEFYGPPTEIKPPPPSGDESEEIPNGPERVDVVAEAAQPLDEERPDEKPNTPLKVQAVDLKCAENAVDHHTDEFEITEEREDENEGEKKCPAELVVRRGQPFAIDVTLSRPYDKKLDKIYLVFEIGKKPLESKKTKVTVKVSQTERTRHWSAVVKETTDNVLSLQIHTPPNCIIGKWIVRLDTRLKCRGGEDEELPEMNINGYKFAQPVIVLFNPWCKDDQVFLDEDMLRNEYVLNENGKIYCGNSCRIGYRPWKFAQFEDFMLDCCMDLLDIAGLQYEKRGNAVDVCRTISAVVNAQDEGGVLEGRWSRPYTDGTCPTSWVGSNAILKEYHTTKKPVKYGQCWVFSAVTTTVCRALGIPCRSVTNFYSAHDCDGSITIDKHYHENGKPIDVMNEDSIWNFHVWNEAWMSRPKLPPGFGGWQAFDATPQEKSLGLYRAGPASVHAIKMGHVSLCYDAAFIFAEVNGDIINHIQKGLTWDRVIKRNRVGKCISTKRPDGMDGYHREDITDQYKFKEGTEQERAAVYRANLESTMPGKYYSFGEEDVKFELDQTNEVNVGSGFDVCVKMQNKSRDERNVHMTLTVESVFYTGVPSAKIKQKMMEIVLKPIKTDEVVVRVAPEEYIYHIEEDAAFRVHVFARVEETNQIHADQEDYRLIKPAIDIKTKGIIKVRQPFTVTVSFLNPMPVSLTQCEWQITGLTKPSTIRQKHSDVEPNDRVEATFELTPHKKGDREIIVSFVSKELMDVSGELWVNVKPAN